VSERRFAVLIGNGLYPEEPKLTDLRCPSRDVDGVAQILQSPKHGAFTSTLVLKDRPHHEILLEVNRTLKKAAKTDLVFLYYSGHGKLDLANRLHLCASDTVIDALEATSVPVESIKNYIDVSPPRQVTLVLDCCFSGAVGNVFARSGVDDQLQLMSGGRGTYIMSASTGVQVALEKEEDEYSIFTKRIIEGIETGAADTNGDGIVSDIGAVPYSGVSSVDEITSDTIPAAFSLGQNYPNPFNPVTTIVYELPAPSFVSLSIYDSAGRLIKRLLNAQRTAGVHKETWDGRDGLGNDVASGIYFYTLDAGELRESRKMILLR